MRNHSQTVPSKGRLWAYGVLFLTLCFAVAPFVTPPFTGYADDQLPVPQPDPFIQPPGWAFSIWGVIYLWLIASALYGALRCPLSSDWGPMRPPLALALALGTVWLAIALAAPILATVTIATMAAAALRALVVSGQAEKGWQSLPVGLFAGWLTAATGVSLGVVLPGFNVLPAWPAALLCLTAVLLVALYIQSLRPEVWSYPLGVGWALFGIVMGSVPREAWVIAGVSALGLAMLLARALLARRRLQ